MSYRGELLKNLLQFVNEGRQDLIAKAIAQRTKHFTLVLENFHHPHNISATIRSSECFGWQDVHVVENEVEYERNPRVNKGADKWLNIHHYDSKHFNTPECLASLKEKGFQLVVTSPHHQSVGLHELDITKKTAIVLGSESVGVSDYSLQQADALLRIDTCGFTESLNVSVSAGIIMQALNQRVRNEGVKWELNDHDREEVYFHFLDQLMENCHALESRYISDRQISDPKRVFASPVS